MTAGRQKSQARRQCAAICPLGLDLSALSTPWSWAINVIFGEYCAHFWVHAGSSAIHWRRAGEMATPKRRTVALIRPEFQPEALLKRVAIIQSNYIPWKGYFDVINHVDEFILLDDVQYTRRDWRNRNLIKTPQGKKWLTIPVKTHGMHTQQNINEVTIEDQAWPMDHWNSIRNVYREAPYFFDYKDRLEDLFRNSKDDHLSQVNYRFLTAILEILGVTTKIKWDRDYAPITGSSTQRLVNLCRTAGATHYLSGPAAKAYMEPEQFAAAGITLEYMDYAGYPEYPQLYPPFDHAVSIIDLILTCGPRTPYYIWGWREVR